MLINSSGKYLIYERIMHTDSVYCCLHCELPLNYLLYRPKFFLERLITHTRASSRNPKEFTCIIFVVVDECGSAHSAFSLSESSKDPNAPPTLRVGNL